MTIIETDRLILRPFAARDRRTYAGISADPRVMRFFPAPYTAEQTDRILDTYAEKRVRFGYAFSAIERKADGALLGKAGLSRFEAEAPIAPCTEIGWRLTPSAWGQGYASEAARAWLAHGFGALGLDEILSFAPGANLPSLRVMQRIGMTRARGLDFDHPAIPPGHDLQAMTVYRISSPSPVSG